MPTPEEIQALTEEVEARKAEKQRARDEKKAAKLKKQRAEKFEMLTAPIILVITVLIGLALWFSV